MKMTNFGVFGTLLNVDPSDALNFYLFVFFGKSILLLIQTASFWNQIYLPGITTYQLIVILILPLHKNETFHKIAVWYERG